MIFKTKLVAFEWPIFHSLIKEIMATSVTIRLTTSRVKSVFWLHIWRVLVMFARENRTLKDPETLSSINSGSLSKRKNLSPFTKDFRGGEHSKESRNLIFLIA